VIDHGTPLELRCCPLVSYVGVSAKNTMSMYQERTERLGSQGSRTSPCSYSYCSHWCFQHVTL
jgi:hypothetical protein